jgi:hypothetical protein
MTLILCRERSTCAELILLSLSSSRLFQIHKVREIPSKSAMQASDAVIAKADWNRIDRIIFKGYLKIL